MLGGKLGLGSLLKNVGKMKELMQQAQEELTNTQITAEAGAGAVKLVLNAKFEAKKVTIDPSLFQEDPTILEELLVAAINDAAQKIETITENKMVNMGSLFDPKED